MHPSSRDDQGQPPSRQRTGPCFSISCDECVMQATDACDDCVVTHLLRHDDAGDESPEPVVLDFDEARAVRLLGRAGLVPDLRYHTAS